MAKRKRTFAWSPIRELMKKAGAEIVSRDAVDILIIQLEERSKKLMSKALQFTKHAKRKKVTDGDIKLAMDLL